MQFPRRQRFSRSSIPALKLTDRDLSIIQLVDQHRFLRSTHIISLLSGSQQGILRRLQVLYHGRFLERPRAQLDYYHKGGSQPIVYGLGDKGYALLHANRAGRSARIRCGEQNRAVGRIFLEHSLLVSDVMVAFALACAYSGATELLMPEPLNSRAASGTSSGLKWKVTLSGSHELGVIPDAVFGLMFPQEKGTARILLFLEADRGTMPVNRQNLAQTSFCRKFLAYSHTWSQGIHRSRFGFHRFRVLTVTSGEQRLNSLVDACRTLNEGQGLFLFVTLKTLQDPGNALKPVWRTTYSRTPVSIFS